MSNLFVRVPKGPPRPGLLPMSGDPNKPYRWIRPGERLVARRVREQMIYPLADDALDEAIVASKNRIAELDNQIKTGKSSNRSSQLRTDKDTSSKMLRQLLNEKNRRSKMPMPYKPTYPKGIPIKPNRIS